MRCPECGEEMIRKIKSWECPNCDCVYIKNYDISEKINEYINFESFEKVKEGVGNITEQIKNSDISDKVNEYVNSENFEKVKEGVGNIAEQVSNQAQKEESYIKNKRDKIEDDSDEEFLISKIIIDGIDFVKIKKREISKSQNAKYARDKEEREEKKVKKGEEKVKQEAVNRPENALFYIDGREGTIAIFDEYIQLDFTGSAVKKYLSRLGGVKKIYYPQINSIQKRDAGDFIMGSLEFEVPGMSYSGIGGGKSENIIHYSYYYQDEADKIYEFVNQRILNIQRNMANPQSNTSDESSVLSELKKAKELLDMGAITQEEFDKIKKELL